MHAGSTIDYIAILRGEVVLVMEASETKFYPGDTVVDRGALHGKRSKRFRLPDKRRVWPLG